MGGLKKLANMYPENIELLDCTSSEKRFYYALKEQLPDRCSIFYSVKWYTQSNNVRENSESDFLIFDPHFGYLTIEVKGGRGIKKNSNTQWILQLDNENFRNLEKSPFEQAEGSMRFFKSYYEEQYSQNFRGVYGFACAFPFYKVSGDLGTEAPKQLIIDFSHMDALEKKINDIFHYWRSSRRNVPFLSTETVNRFVTMINKRISISTISGATIEQQERRLKILNNVQENYLDLVENYNNAFFIGGAGTGKTWIALKKAMRDSMDDKDVLLLCFNSELALFLKRETKHYKRITCKTFWELAKENTFDFGRLANDIELRGVFTSLSANNLLPKYHSIIIDEAQDFNEEWALSTRLFLREESTSNIYVFYDNEQNIFNRNFKNGFLIDTPPFILKENLRNTTEIIKWVKESTNLGNYTKPNNLVGVKPEKYLFKKRKDARKRLEALLKQLIQKELVKTSSIIVLSNRKIENSILLGNKELGPFQIIEVLNSELSENNILYKTIQSFKGLESDIVIYLNHINGQVGRNLKMDFVAYTRAKFLLYVIEYEE